MADVKIDLNGKSIVLVPSLRAARSIDALGGVQEAVRQIGGMSLNAYVTIIAGATNSQLSDIEEDVFRTGMARLAEPLSRFLSLIANGGKEFGGTQGTGSGEQ